MVPPEHAPREIRQIGNYRFRIVKYDRDGDRNRDRDRDADQHHMTVFLTLIMN